MIFKKEKKQHPFTGDFTILNNRFCSLLPLEDGAGKRQRFRVKTLTVDVPESIRSARMDEGTVGT